MLWSSGTDGGLVARLACRAAGVGVNWVDDCAGTDPMAHNIAKFLNHNLKAPVSNRQMFFFQLQPYDPMAYFQ